MVRVPAAGPDSFDMSSYYHAPCFTVPRKYKHLGIEEFVTEHVTDTSDDQSILTDIEAFAKSMEQAAATTSKTKQGDQDGGGDTLMDRIARVVKEELTKDSGPKTKKVKKDEDAEFREMVELYKQHHKKKIDDLKDYLRYDEFTFALVFFLFK